MKVGKALYFVVVTIVLLVMIVSIISLGMLLGGSKLVAKNLVTMATIWLTVLSVLTVAQVIELVFVLRFYNRIRSAMWTILSGIRSRVGRYEEESDTTDEEEGE